MNKKSLCSILKKFPDDAEIRIVSRHIRSFPEPRACYKIGKIELCLGKEDDSYILIFPIQED